MNFGELEDYMLDNFPEFDDRKMLQRTANRVIRNFNSKITGVLTTAEAFEYIGSMHEGNTYTWAPAAAGTDEWYFALAGTVDPEIDEPTTVWEKADDVDTATEMTKGTPGSLSAGEWGYADDDTAFETVYVRLTVGGDPSSQADGYIKSVIEGTDFDWDITNYHLTLPDTLNELLDVYLNDEDIERRPIGYVRDSNNTTEKIYAVTDRNVLEFPSGLIANEETGTHNTIDVEYYSDIAQIATGMTRATELDVPPQFEELFITGVLYYLAGAPKYRDETIYNDNKEKFLVELKTLEDLELGRMPFTRRDLNYTY